MGPGHSPEEFFLFAASARARGLETLAWAWERWWVGCRVGLCLAVIGRSWLLPPQECADSSEVRIPATFWGSSRLPCSKTQTKHERASEPHAYSVSTSPDGPWGTRGQRWPRGTSLGFQISPPTPGCVTLGNGVSLSEPSFLPLMGAPRRPTPQGPLGSSDALANGWGCTKYVWLLVIIYEFVFQ